MFLHLAYCGRGKRVFGRPEFRLRYQSAKILIANPGQAQQWEIRNAELISNCNLCSYVGANATFPCSHMKPCGTVDSVAVKQGHRGKIFGSTDTSQGLRKGRALQKRKRGTGMQLHIRHGQSYIPSTNQCPEIKSCTMRYTPATASPASATSHSSRPQDLPPCHQRPLLRQGPAAIRTFALAFLKTTTLGISRVISILAANGGRNILRASRGEDLLSRTGTAHKDWKGST